MARKGRKKGKIRIDWRPNVENPTRESSSDITKKHREDKGGSLEDRPTHEAFKGKGRLARRKTVDTSRTGGLVDLERYADEPAPADAQWSDGVVVAIHGLYVKVDDGQRIRNCVVRRVLKSLMVEQRNVVAVGDNVSFTPIDDATGVIERIGERSTLLKRRYQNREHLIVTNVEQAVIVSAVAEPDLRIHLVDRYVVAAASGDLRPVIVFNKIDLLSEEELADLDEYESVYRSLGYPVVRTSAAQNVGIEALREAMKDRKSVLAGVSGVGKSSLINAVQPGLNLTVKPVNRATKRGQHTTTVAQLLRLDFGGYVVDTPGIRQFAFWNFDRMNLEAYFEEFVPYVPQCRFPNCSHIEEPDCAVKQAVEEGKIAWWRYESYLKIFEDHEEFMSPWER